MMDFFSYLRHNLFGSTISEQFNDKKSLYENFTAMCSLSCLKTRSSATKELAKHINMCRLHMEKKPYQSLSYSQRMHDIASLELVKHAIQHWRNWHERNNRISTRVGLINS